MNAARAGAESDGRTACITLDLENNWGFESDDLQYLVFDHIDEYIEWMGRLELPLTVFVVGEILEDRPDIVRRFDAELDVEFQLHSHRHDMHGRADIEREIRDGIAAFERVLGRKPRGYRAPRYIIDDSELEALSDAGFEFDSSICPSYRPGVYNNLGKPTEPYFPDDAPDLLEVPISVHPWLQIPFGQSYLRLLQRPYLWLLGHSPLPDPLVFNSHLHDFYHTAAHEQLDGSRRWLFNYNLDSSKRLFEGFVDVLRERGYRFRKLGTIVDRMHAESKPLKP